ncbi:MAG: DNA replication and repair protein RecF [Chloroflexi bacterium]|nr:DNA replication and repair protein RecF [Chloroflexota bacterium]
MKPYKEVVIHLTRLKLTGFRNHVDTDINLAPGLVVFTGANGHGKSGLLEAVHMLSVGKSLRAGNDREIVNHSIARDGGHVQALGVFNSGAESVRAQFDIQISPSSAESFNRLNVGSKEWRINGVKVPPVEFVGRANVVIFEAGDLDLALGAAAVRRRYLDILIGQFDTEYVQALLRLNRVRASRNALLRGSYEVHDFEEEIAFWNGRFCDESAKIIQTRREVMQLLQSRAAPTHAELSEGEALALAYRPNLGSSVMASTSNELEDSALRTHIHDALMASKRKEQSAGHMVIGPHLDDFAINIAGAPARRYASRGQARTAALSLRLAEATLVTEFAGRDPIIAFDDVLSEMDSFRRRTILERSSQYEQTLLTATDDALVGQQRLSSAQNFRVVRGNVSLQP